MKKGRRVVMGVSLRGFLVAGIISTSSAVAFGADSKDSKTAFPPCTTTATDADRKAAQGAFAAGQGSFNESDYSTAITYWRDAYRRDCSAHALLLNLARAYELKGDKSESVNALETYLQRKPDAADAEQIRRRIDNLKTQITATEKAAPPPPLPATSASVPAPPPPVSTTSAPPPSNPPDSSDSGRSRSPVPLFIAGGGGVLAVVGALVFAGGASKVQEAEDACPSRERCPAEIADKGNDGRKQQTLGGVMLGVGVAAAGGGLLWYFLSSPSSEAPKTAFSLRRPMAQPTIAPGYAGISLGASF